MKRFTRIRMERMHSIEFLLASDLEVELHPGEDPGLGAHSAEVLAEMLKEARCEGDCSGQSPLAFILYNGDTDARFEGGYESLWQELEHLPSPCYHVLGNHEGAYFDGDGDKWKNFFGYEDTYYAWEYSAPQATATFIVLDTWCTRKEDGKLKINEGSGKQALRAEQKEWLKQMLDRAPGLVVVFAHAHYWMPNCRNQDNEDVDELMDIIKGTYEEGTAHRHANIFFNGGHHGESSCNKVDGVWFIDPMGAIHKGYARAVIDLINKKMDYVGRLEEKSYQGLDLVGYGETER